MIISSQRYIDNDRVEEKRANSDYTASVYTLEYDDIEYRIVVDGHHSIEAARRDGVAAIYVEIDGAIKR